MTAQLDASLASGLREIKGVVVGNTGKFDTLFPAESFPKLRAEVIAAYQRRLPVSQIAKYLSGKLPQGESISPEAVKKWLTKQESG